MVVSASVLAPREGGTENGSKVGSTDVAKEADANGTRTKFEAARGMPSREAACDAPLAPVLATTGQQSRRRRQQTAGIVKSVDKAEEGAEHLECQLRALCEQNDQALQDAAAKLDAERHERRKAEALLTKVKRSAAARLSEALQQARDTTEALEESRRETKAAVAREGAKVARAGRAILAAKQAAEEAAAAAAATQVAAAKEEAAKVREAAERSVLEMQARVDEALRDIGERSAEMHAESKATERSVARAAAAKAAKLDEEAAVALGIERARLAEQREADRIRFEHELEQERQMDRERLDRKVAIERARVEAEIITVRAELDRERTKRLEIEECLLATKTAVVQPLAAEDVQEARNAPHEYGATDSDAARAGHVSPAPVVNDKQDLLQSAGAMPQDLQLVELDATEDEIKTRCSSRQQEFAQDCAATLLQANARGYLAKIQVARMRTTVEAVPVPTLAPASADTTPLLTRARSHAQLRGLHLSVDDAARSDPLPSLGKQVGLVATILPFTESNQRSAANKASPGHDGGSTLAKSTDVSGAATVPAKTGHSAHVNGDASALFAPASLLSPVGNSVKEHSWAGKTHIQPSQTLTDRMNQTSRAIRETARFRRSERAPVPSVAARVTADVASCVTQSNVSSAPKNERSTPHSNTGSTPTAAVGAARNAEDKLSTENTAQGSVADFEFMSAAGRLAMLRAQ